VTDAPAATLTVTILGCGGSGGVPMLGGADGRGDWGRCDKEEPRNRRTRSSVVIAQGGRRLLVDAGPDLRAQLLATGISAIEALAITHTHADHIMGLDEIRMLNRLRGSAMDVFATYQTLSELKTRFEYAFRPPTPPAFYRPALIPRPVTPGEVVEMAGMPVRVLRQDHKVMDTLGFRVGRFAYSTDVVALPEDSLAALEGLDTWVVGCFGPRPHPVHAHVDQVIAWVERLKPRRTVLTHMGTEMDFRAMAASLPPGIEPAHDGMVLEVPAG
jgi:phosphoribosyl 1,2-cyclic phosphate phosphodiesterase